MSVFEEVMAERARQDARWGVQDHPNVFTPEQPRLRCILSYHDLPATDSARTICDLRHKQGIGSWADIAVEEMCEAVEKGDDDVACREELVQLAAVVVAWIECIDRRKP